MILISNDNYNIIIKCHIINALLLITESECLFVHIIFLYVNQLPFGSILRPVICTLYYCILKYAAITHRSRWHWTLHFTCMSSTLTAHLWSFSWSRVKYFLNNAISRFSHIWLFWNKQIQRNVIPRAATNMNLNNIKGILSIDSALYEDHACQTSMLYHS